MSTQLPPEAVLSLLHPLYIPSHCAIKCLLDTNLFKTLVTSCIIRSPDDEQIMLEIRVRKGS
jgi:hypothetical protein